MKVTDLKGTGFGFEELEVAAPAKLFEEIERVIRLELSPDEGASGTT